MHDYYINYILIYYIFLMIRNIISFIA